MGINIDRYQLVCSTDFGLSLFFFNTFVFKVKQYLNTSEYSNLRDCRIELKLVYTAVDVQKNHVLIVSNAMSIVNLFSM